MSEPTWGLLAKSAVDPEKIEEAIDRIIDDHNDDPDSHLAAGQALQSHKAAEIIDHVVGSVIADKLTHTENVLRANFESIGAFTTSGSVTLESWGWVRLYVEDGAVNESYLRGSFEWSNWFVFDKDYLAQFACSVGVSPNYTVYLAFGAFLDDSSAWYGFGFKLTSSGAYGFFKCGSNYYLTSLITNDNSLEHVYRVYYDNSDDEVEFFIDGVSKGTIAKTGTPPDDTGHVEVNVVPGSSSDGNVELHEIIVSRGI